MIRKQLLFKNTFWMILALGAQALGQAINMFLIGRIIGPEALGIYSFAIALVLPAFMACNLGLRTQILSDVGSSSAYIHYQTIRILGILAGFVIIGIALFLTQSDKTVITITLLMAVVKSAEFYADLAYGFWQRAEEHSKIALSTTYRSFAGVICMGLAVYMGGGIEIAVACLALGWLSVVLLYDVVELKKLVQEDENIARRWDWLRLKVILWQGFPLGTSSLINALKGSLPKYFIVGYWGHLLMGQLAVYLYAFQLMSMVANAVGHAFAPRMAYHFQACEIRKFCEFWIIGSMAILAMSAMGAVLIAVMGNWAVGIIFGAEFVIGGPFSRLLGMACLFSLLPAVSGYFMSATRAFWPQLPLQLATLVLTGGLCYLLLPTMGAEGIPWILGSVGFFSIIGMNGITLFRVRNSLRETR